MLFTCFSFKDISYMYSVIGNYSDDKIIRLYYIILENYYKIKIIIIIIRIMKK